MSRDTRTRILEATIETLKAKGYAGTSTRVIAGVGGFNPALVFYYFGTLNDLLLAALEHSSAERLQRYRTALDEAASLDQLVALLGRIYREDLESGHIRVVSELVAGSVAVPELGPRVVELMEPWLELAESAIERALAGSPVLELATPRRLAYAAVTFYLGANLVSRLAPEQEDLAGLLDDAERLAPLFDAALRGEARG
jgi:AcrR family transcriptional regulator